VGLRSASSSITRSKHFNRVYEKNNRQSDVFSLHSPFFLGRLFEREKRKHALLRAKHEPAYPPKVCFAFKLLAILRVESFDTQSGGLRPISNAADPRIRLLSGSPETPQPLRGGGVPDHSWVGPGRTPPPVGLKRSLPRMPVLTPEAFARVVDKGDVTIPRGRSRLGVRSTVFNLTRIFIVIHDSSRAEATFFRM